VATPQTAPTPPAVPAPVRRLSWRKRIRVPRAGLLAFLVVLGPGIITASADNDAGGITTYSIAGAKFGYGLLWILFLTTFSLAVTQEMGARMAIVTGKGLGALIREKFGIRWTAIAMIALLLANFGSIAADVAGIGAALEIFGISKYISVPLAVAALYLLVVKGSYSWIEKTFLFSAVIYVAYVISGVQAHPDWGAAFQNTLVPSFQFNQAYIIAFIATIGTTITPWGQFFIQSYCADKRLGLDDLKSERADVYVGAFVTNFIAFFIVIATAATLNASGQTDIADASQAAAALEPLAGRFAATLFAFGLFNAAPIFYGIFIASLVIAALFVLIPGLSLVGVMFITQMVNGILLPIILIFAMLIVNDKAIMGKHTNNHVFNTVGWVTIGGLVLVSLLLIPATVIQGLGGS
jgi:NRAMP (natural resistance-associated macrophage protein)-like metal ion transporter